MISNGDFVDGSWELSVLVTDVPGLQDGYHDLKLRVKGDLHMGGLMVKLVEALPGELRVDWSDHAVWWPEKRRWLTRNSRTLDQYGVQSDARLAFTPMHKPLKLQMPDLQVVELRVNFSTRLFSTMILICKELGIRHPEEISLMRKPGDLKTNIVTANGKEANGKNGRSHNTSFQSSDRGSNGSLPSSSQRHHNGSTGNNSADGSLPGSPSNSLHNTSSSMIPVHTPQGTLLRPSLPSSPYSPYSPQTPMMHVSFNGNLTPSSIGSLSFEGADMPLALSPQTSAKDGLAQLPRPRNYAEKARINASWLSSAYSLMEQGVQANDLLLLRFKYLSFYDLNSKYDAVRINQLYEQAKWSLLCEELECSEEEAVMFAALQLQVQLRASYGGGGDVPDGGGPGGEEEKNGGQDDIDAALNDLQVSLEGSGLSTSASAMSDITNIPELADTLRYLKPKRLTLKGYKRAFFAFRDTSLLMYRSAEESKTGTPTYTAKLNRCEVHPEVNMASSKFCLKLLVPSESEGLQEFWLRFDTEEQYCRWAAACKLATKGRTMADASYEGEVSNIQNFLSLQRPPPKTCTLDPSTLSSSVHPEDFLPARTLKKLKTKQALSRLLEAHANVSELPAVEAKMKYIRAWQGLPEQGLAWFICAFSRDKKKKEKEELLGVAKNRVVRADLNSGHVGNSWLYSTMAEWKLNWELKQLELVVGREKIQLKCVSADARVINEMIGAYVFLSLRSPDRSQTLNEEQFYKLIEQRYKA